MPGCPSCPYGLSDVIAGVVIGILIPLTVPVARRIATWIERVRDVL